MMLWFLLKDEPNLARLAVGPDHLQRREEAVVRGLRANSAPVACGRAVMRYGPRRDGRPASRPGPDRSGRSRAESSRRPGSYDAQLSPRAGCAAQVAELDVDGARRSRARRRLRREAVLPVLRGCRIRVRRRGRGRESCGRAARLRRGAAGRRRELRRRAVHAGARALRRPGASGARAAAGHRSRAVACSCSTHGVQVYHPSPVDYWRWTHEGLRRVFEQNATWSRLTIEPGAGHRLGACDAPRHVRRDRVCGGRVLARPPVWLLNTAGAALDARSATLRDPVPGSLIPNFHVVATV